jgi:predicted NBD/HSP70 family sugar kinase
VTSLGIDIGGTSIKLAALRDGKVTWTGRSAAYARPTREQLIATLRAMAIPSSPSVLGVCLPGLFDPATRTITNSVNVPGLIGTPLDAILAAALGTGLPSAAVFSDATATAVDVYLSRGLSGRLLLLALGTGIGAAVWDEDAGPLRVDGDSPGHFGQLDVSLDDRPPLGPDGGAGSLEAYLGAPALAQAHGAGFYAQLPRLPISSPPLRALIRAIRIGHAIYRPHHVCLAGGIGTALRSMLAALHGAANSNLTNVARAGWTLTCGEHDLHAAIGAARMAAAKAP